MIYCALKVTKYTQAVGLVTIIADTRSALTSLGASIAVITLIAGVGYLGYNNLVDGNRARPRGETNKQSKRK